jgi:hypothetical protein
LHKSLLYKKAKFFQISNRNLSKVGTGTVSVKDSYDSTTLHSSSLQIFVKYFILFHKNCYITVAVVAHQTEQFLELSIDEGRLDHGLEPRPVRRQHRLQAGLPIKNPQKKPT